jgi:hypothetical protein
MRHKDVPAGCGGLVPRRENNAAVGISEAAGLAGTIVGVQPRQEVRKPST